MKNIVEQIEKQSDLPDIIFMKETLQLVKNDIALLVFGDHPDFITIDSRYAFLEEDHDLWDFIVERISDNKLFSFIWSDSYDGINRHLDKNDFVTLTEVQPRIVSTTIYE